MRKRISKILAVLLTPDHGAFIKRVATAVETKGETKAPETKSEDTESGRDKSRRRTKAEAPAGDSGKSAADYKIVLLLPDQSTTKAGTQPTMPDCRNATIH